MHVDIERGGCLGVQSDGAQEECGGNTGGSIHNVFSEQCVLGICSYSFSNSVMESRVDGERKLRVVLGAEGGGRRAAIGGLSDIAGLSENAATGTGVGHISRDRLASWASYGRRRTGSRCASRSSW